MQHRQRERASSSNITALVDGIRNGTLPGVAAHPRCATSLVGGDDIVPMARLTDTTRVGQRAGTPTTFAGHRPTATLTTASTSCSDDPYGDLDPIQWLNRRLYVADLAVGGLVETPPDMTAAVETYLAGHGVLDPSKAYVAGYDWMTDGATSVATTLATSLTSANGGTAPTISSNIGGTRGPRATSWGRSAPMPASPGYCTLRPRVGLSADGWSATGEPSEPGGLARPSVRTSCSRWAATRGSVFLTPRTSAGRLPTRPISPRRSTAKAGCVATTGFGYGDANTVGLHERLMTLFAAQLDGAVTLGDGLAYAKQQYYGTSGLYGVYDEKVWND